MTFPTQADGGLEWATVHPEMLAVSTCAGDYPAAPSCGESLSVALLLDECFGSAVFRVHKDDVCGDSAGHIDG